MEPFEGRFDDLVDRLRGSHGATPLAEGQGGHFQMEELSTSIRLVAELPEAAG